MFYLVFLLMMILWMMRNAPELLEERSRMASNVKGWDKILVTLSSIALIGLLVVAALDAGTVPMVGPPRCRLG